MGIEEGTYDEIAGDGTGLSRRGLIVRGGLLAAGLTAFGAQAGESLAAGATTKLAVVTHGDTGSFWSVFKNGVDQAAKDLKGRGISVTQVYANNDVSKQVSGINAAIAAKVNVIATSVPDASALKDPLAKAAAKGIEIITVNSGEGAFDALKTYDCHVGQDEKIAGEGAGKQFNIPGTLAKVKAYFTANKSTDALLGLDPDVTVPALGAAPSGTKVGTFDVSADVIKNLKAGKMLFAIDQQQYLQGYLPVVFAVLFVNNLNTVGGGQPVLTGPGIINKANAAKVAALAAKGTR